MKTNGINLINKRFGKLIVIEECEERKNGSIVWRCKCDCGGYINVRGDTL